jgi:uncharacterized integral membrane protein
VGFCFNASQQEYVEVSSDMSVYANAVLTAILLLLLLLLARQPQSNKELSFKVRMSFYFFFNNRSFVSTIRKNTIR